ncbi:MAG: hypothetical protein IJ460_04845 [Clostridia bacterium]|nr:hypothetical protein [Clostridia bacterium]
MKKNIKKTVLIVSICVCALSAAVFASPGSDGDPLISLSYITDKLLPEIYSYVDSKVAEVSAGGSSAAPSFVVVDVKKGQKVVCEAGCELILRMGSATINASPSGGLSDVTTGGDLTQNTPMPANHLLIVPVSDGRGITMTADGKVMIKGTYTLQ